MIRVTLSARDMARAREVGIERVRSVGTASPKFSYESTGRSAEDTHAIGAQAELAFCVATGLPWPATVNGFREVPDVEPNWEVRFSPGRVKVATNDPPERLVAHVSGEPPSFEIYGFIVAGWVQRNVPATDPGSRGRLAHFVSPNLLAPIDPGFHDVCAWENAIGGWRCAFCGLTLKGLSRLV